jgi:hypothetical protein
MKLKIVFKNRIVQIMAQWSYAAERVILNFSLDTVKSGNIIFKGYLGKPWKG